MILDEKKVRLGIVRAIVVKNDHDSSFLEEFIAKRIEKLLHLRGFRARPQRRSS